MSVTAAMGKQGIFVTYKPVVHKTCGVAVLGVARNDAHELVMLWIVSAACMSAGAPVVVHTGVPGQACKFGQVVE